MNAMSNEWNSEGMVTGSAMKDGLYNPSTTHPAKEEDGLTDVHDKQSKNLSRLAEAMVILSITAVVAFATYRLVTNILH